MLKKSKKELYDGKMQREINKYSIVSKKEKEKERKNDHM